MDDPVFWKNYRTFRLNVQGKSRADIEAAKTAIRIGPLGYALGALAAAMSKAAIAMQGFNIQAALSSPSGKQRAWGRREMKRQMKRRPQ